MIRVLITAVGAVFIFLSRIPEFIKDIKLSYYRYKARKAAQQSLKYKIKAIQDETKTGIDKKGKTVSDDTISGHFGNSKF